MPRLLSLTGSGGGGGAPVDATFVTLAAEAGLSSETLFGDLLDNGTLAARPAASTKGRYYLVSSGASSGNVYYDNGSTWALVVDAAALPDHLADTSDAHAASAITNTPAGNIAATTVQAALNELDTDKAAASHGHVAADVSDFAEVVRDTMGTALVAGSNVTITPNDGADTITIAATGGGGAMVVQEGDTTVAAAATTLDFGNGFDVTESPANEANIDLDLGEYTGTDLPIASGGTGASTAAAAFDALSPVTTRGDIIYRNATTNARLAVGAAGTVLGSDGTDPAWVKRVRMIEGNYSGSAPPKSVTGTTSETTLLQDTLGFASGFLSDGDLLIFHFSGTCVQSTGSAQNLTFKFKCTANSSTTTLLDTGTISIGSNASERAWVAEVWVFAHDVDFTFFGNQVDLMTASGRLQISGAGSETWHPQTAMSSTGGAHAYGTGDSAYPFTNASYGQEWDFTVTPGSTSWTVDCHQQFVIHVPKAI